MKQQKDGGRPCPGEDCTVRRCQEEGLALGGGGTSGHIRSNERLLGCYRRAGCLVPLEDYLDYLE